MKLDESSGAPSAFHHFWFHGSLVPSSIPFRSFGSSSLHTHAHRDTNTDARVFVFVLVFFRFASIVRFLFAPPNQHGVWIHQAKDTLAVFFLRRRTSSGTVGIRFVAVVAVSRRRRKDQLVRHEPPVAAPGGCWFLYPFLRGRDSLVVRSHGQPVRPPLRQIRPGVRRVFQKQIPQRVKGDLRVVRLEGEAERRSLAVAAASDRFGFGRKGRCQQDGFSCNGQAPLFPVAVAAAASFHQQRQQPAAHPDSQFLRGHRCGAPVGFPGIGVLFAQGIHQRPLSEQDFFLGDHLP
mmetsp:Transcript_27992/g.59967  ORF Transcript_27992/g.59967 Transcript_27992/m.59967 type:complete len:292 (-) Transcript_27992:918-1793(-)